MVVCIEIQFLANLISIMAGKILMFIFKKKREKLIFKKPLYSHMLKNINFNQKQQQNARNFIPSVFKEGRVIKYREIEALYSMDRYISSVQEIFALKNGQIYTY